MRDDQEISSLVLLLISYISSSKVAYVSSSKEGHYVVRVISCVTQDGIEAYFFKNNQGTKSLHTDVQ